MNPIAASPQQGSGAFSLIFIGLVFVAMYFLMIRPQQKRRRDYVDLLRSLEVGDEIETVAGIFGTIRKLDDERASVEVAPGVTLEMARAAIRRKVVEPEQEDSDDVSS